jgi:transketolase
MIITRPNVKTWSAIGPRATFGMAALELGGRIDSLMILTGDTSTSAGLERFKKAYPEKLLDVGIAEQNMMGIAAGLASEGAKVFTTTFAPFQTMRCCEQIKMNLGYMRHNVCMVGLASGVVLGPLGYSHCCIEDVALMRAIPGITVISPADCGETFKATLAAADHHESVYIRLTGGAGTPPVYEDDYDFHIGKAKTLREGSDATIIAAGTMVHWCLRAADLLAQQGLSAGVVNMHTIKPADDAAIEQACRSSRLIVTVEEHSVVGGLGSAVAECKTTLKNAPPQLSLGLPHHYGKAGDYSYLLEKSGLTAPQIAQSILKKYAEVN